LPEYWKLDITLRLRNPLTLRSAETQLSEHRLGVKIGHDRVCC